MKTIQSTSSGATAATPRKGFTLAELLVVLVVVALLFSLRLAAMPGAQDRSKVAQCAANLRQVTLAVQIYGGENNDQLPVIGSGSGWPWDLPWNVGNTLLSYGLQKRNFFCPGTAPRFSDLSNFADPTLDAYGAPKNLWDFGKNRSTPFHESGYAFAFSGPYSQLLPSAQNTTLQPEKTPNPTNAFLPSVYTGVSDRALAADATICNPAAVASVPLSARYASTLNYTSVGGGAGQFYLPITSPHLYGRFPAGGNVGFKDGHVVWRKFDDMRQQAASGASYWW